VKGWIWPSQKIWRGSSYPNMMMLIDVFADGHSDVVHLLLEAGAEVNIYDSVLMTPLHLAALGVFTAD